MPPAGGTRGGGRRRGSDGISRLQLAALNPASAHVVVARRNPPNDAWRRTCPVRGVAKISMTVANGRYRVTIRGRLTELDLRRLARICSPALEYRELPLEICFGDSIAPDEPARFFLTRLASRGATITGLSGLQSHGNPGTP